MFKQSGPADGTSCPNPSIMVFAVPGLSFLAGFKCEAQEVRTNASFSIAAIQSVGTTSNPTPEAPRYPLLPDIRKLMNVLEDGDFACYIQVVRSRGTTGFQKWACCGRKGPHNSVPAALHAVHARIVRRGKVEDPIVQSSSDATLATRS